MAKVKLHDTPACTDEQSLAHRAQVSPPHLRRKLPPRALPPLDGPSPAKVLRQLVQKLEGPNVNLYTRIANRALEDGDTESIANATEKVQREIDERLKSRRKLHETYPLLYPKPAA
ncbi:hypothetical protein [Hymenobacter sp. BT559]|uniref:hypothetical protein n=1 Tax=Hymenobacter sp. BT559 TaxID=2795729 RepID=UPI0018EAB089|nr:hypothetical protein [Hymenobacter sp. BT559]MBJ6145714.1 hypothetical protein [Hymenobacter sp. BT559]